jgi:hypothetical protein
VVDYRIYKGKQEDVAEKICSFYNEQEREVVNIMYSISFDDVFQTEPMHHAIIYFKLK